MKNLRQEIADALAQSKLSSKACTDFVASIEKRLAELSKRDVEIRPARPYEPIGTKRQELLITGSSDQIQKLDTEHEQLQLEVTQLQAQADELRRRKQDAIARESAELMPDYIQSLESALTDAENARDKLTTALNEVSQAFEQIFRARGLSVNAGYEVPVADQSVSDRLASLQPWAINQRLRVFNVSTTSREVDLGIKLPHDHLRRVS